MDAMRRRSETPLESSVTWEASKDGLALRLRGLSLRLSWAAPGVVRVTAVPVGDGAPLCAYGPMLDPAYSWRPARVEVGETPQGLVATDGVLSVHIDTCTGAFTYRDAGGTLLLHEHAKTMEPRATAGEGYRALLDLAFCPGEALYGLGQHEDGRLNYRGSEQDLYQHHVKAPVPFLVSSRGWGLLWHGYSAMTFRDDERGSHLEADCVPEMDYFVIAGGTLDGVIKGYRRLTGAAPLPPRWAFGFVQSRERYQTQEDLVEVAHRYAQLGLAPECVMLDWQYWPDELWGQKSLDPKRFPEPAGMCRRLHEMGTRLMVSVWPQLHNDGPDQLEFLVAGKLLADGHTYDAFDPQARGMFWRQAHDGLFAHGVDAWWCYSAEPFQTAWEPSRAQRRRLSVDKAERYLGPAVSNAYPLLHNSGIWEGQRGSGKRVLIVSRSAWAGQQRFGTFVWSGDVSGSWETLRRQIPAGLNLCASGIPYWTCDIGSFFDPSGQKWLWDGDFDAGVADAGYRELFLRWFQYGTFVPMMRAHGTDAPREIWHFGEPGTPVYDTLVRFVELRKDLLPYLYSTAAAVYFDGYTMMRALAFDFSHDPQILGIEDQFMLGPALLVCPVTTPGAASRPVYLPEGSAWIDVWDGTAHEGGRWIEAPAPLQTIPIYARSGSIVPLGSALLVFPGADGTFTLYEDAGDGWGYETGEHTRRTLQWDDTQRILSIGPPTGTYPGAPSVRRFRAVLVQPGDGWQSPAHVGYVDVDVDAEQREGSLQLRP